ncbi:MAG: sigma 54-interacting transcriptional regulator [Bacillota bacterium]
MAPEIDFSSVGNTWFQLKLYEAVPKKLLTLDNRCTLADALKRIEEAQVKTAAVLNGGEPYGIFSFLFLPEDIIQGSSFYTIEPFVKRKIQCFEANSLLMETLEKLADEVDGIFIYHQSKLVGVASTFELFTKIKKLLVQDIFNLKNVIEESKKMNQLNTQLDILIKNSYDGIFITDGEGKVLRVNNSVLRMLGAKEDELLGKNTGDLVKDGYYSSSSVLESIKLRQPVTKIMYSRTGVEIMATSTPIFDEDGKVIYVITNSRDMTDLSKLLRELEQTKELSNRYLTELQYLRKKHLEHDRIVAESPIMLKVIETAQKIAKVDSTVLIRGESGVGKEVIAKFIHKESYRNNGPFIAVNCAAIPEPLLEAELFGYESGAFTGASRSGKPGMFELADKGTLFLDEVGELPLAIQAKLLRALESSEVMRVGGIKAKKIDVRIIAATNKDLEEMVLKGVFRRDIYYRLNVIPLYIPPLRERKEDIIALTNFFLREFCNKNKCRRFFSQEALSELVNQQWPGNTRELRNVVERVAATATGEEIRFIGNINSVMYNTPSNSKGDALLGTSLEKMLAMTEKEVIQNTLRLCGGNKVRASKMLGIHRSVLYKKLKMYGLLNKDMSS